MRRRTCVHLLLFVTNLLALGGLIIFSTIAEHKRYLYRRSIRPLEEPYCERCPTVTESDVHLFFNCPLAQGTWSALGFAPNPAIVRQPWLLCLSADLPEQVHVDVIPLLLWHIWKARNAMIFDHIDSTPRDIIRRVVQDIDAWSCRFNQLKPDLLVWKTWLQSCY
ncbi:hypothetical protein PVAP13_3KG286727 [Panicum virgatum]|uniref:Reverse transcriptase zinc-binding domain-containing protein n=1 Tax=Panicum virgatum TaxID=38727 RepID=A0A8T0V1I9_PANVG|nr:hypothetical protein PVAP13_3KG286727 [Panicum virgatum]